MLTALRALEQMEVSVYFEEQGLDTKSMNSEMFATFPGMVAQQESVSISQNMRWSYKKRMESGEFNCCAPAYGFDLINGKLVINETEAAVIRRIFDLYLQGIGMQTIALRRLSKRLCILPPQLGQTTGAFSVKMPSL